MNHVSVIVTKVGAKEISVPIRICLQRLFKLKIYRKLSPSHNSQLNPVVVDNPESYKITNSAENSTNVIIKNDQNEDTDHPTIEI